MRAKLICVCTTAESRVKNWPEKKKCPPPSTPFRALAAVRSKALLFYGFLFIVCRYSRCLWGYSILSLFCFAVLCALSDLFRYVYLDWVKILPQFLSRRHFFCHGNIFNVVLLYILLFCRSLLYVCCHRVCIPTKFSRVLFIAHAVAFKIKLQSLNLYGEG